MSQLWADQQTKDVSSWNRSWATEVETSGSYRRLYEAALRLAVSRAPQKMLKVPERNMGLAMAALRDAKVAGWVRNMHSVQEIFVTP